MGWLCAGALPERSAWLHHYARDLLTPARCAELPPAAREAGQHWPRRRSFPSKSAALAGSDDAEARCAASRRCGGFAQSCGRCRSFDTGRSDPCARHQHGSCGRRFVRLVRFCAESSLVTTRPSTACVAIAGDSAARIALLWRSCIFWFRPRALCPFARWSSGESARKKSSGRGFNTRICLVEAWGDASVVS